MQGAISCALLEGAHSNRLPLSLCVVVYRAYKCWTFFIIEFVGNPCLADLAFTQHHLQEFPVGTPRRVEQAPRFSSTCSQPGLDFPERYELTSPPLRPCRLPAWWFRWALGLCVFPLPEVVGLDMVSWSWSCLLLSCQLGASAGLVPTSW